MLTKQQVAKQVRQALENLHDPAHLQKLWLTKALASDGTTRPQAARELRSGLLACIEELRPPDDLAPRARERRPYILLYGRYVEGMSTPELVEELAIGIRQLRREHRLAMAALTDLVWERLASRLDPSIGGPPADEAVPPSGVEEMASLEVEQLIGQARPEHVPLSAVVQGILPVLDPVAARHHVDLCSEMEADLPPVWADRVALRQALLGLLSYALDQAVGGSVTLEEVASPNSRLLIRASGQRRAAQGQADVRLHVSHRLIASLGGLLSTTEEAGHWEAVIELPSAREIPILVMDDNEGLVELFRRYLAGRHYRVIRALSAEQALDIARGNSPGLVILDVMMPGQDGWEVLQRLRGAAELRDTPILVCSVLNEPEIAQGLGASDYLTKPVSQDALLAKVEKWCSGRF